MPMLPMSRRTFIDRQFRRHLNLALFSLNDSETHDFAVALGRPLADNTKRYLEWAISCFASEIWFESIAPSPREFERRVSIIRDSADQLTRLLMASDPLYLATEYLRYIYGNFYSRGDSPPPASNTIESLKNMADVSQVLARAFAPYVDRRQRHDLTLKSFLWSLINVGKTTGAVVSLPTNEVASELDLTGNLELATAFLKFVRRALNIATEKASFAIQESSYRPESKSKVADKLRCYQSMGWRPLTDCLRPLRNVQSGRPRDFVERDILASSRGRGAFRDQRP